MSLWTPICGIFFFLHVNGLSDFHTDVCPVSLKNSQSRQSGLLFLCVLDSSKCSPKCSNKLEIALFEILMWKSRLDTSLVNMLLEHGKTNVIVTMTVELLVKKEIIYKKEIIIIIFKAPLGQIMLFFCQQRTESHSHWSNFSCILHPVLSQWPVRFIWE